MNIKNPQQFIVEGFLGNSKPIKQINFGLTDLNLDWH